MKYSSKWAAALSVTAAAALVACGGCGGLDVKDTSAQGTAGTTVVALTSNAALGTIASTDAAPIVFANGLPELGVPAGTSANMVIKTAAGTTPTVVLTAGTSVLDGDVRIASLSFIFLRQATGIFSPFWSSRGFTPLVTPVAPFTVTNFAVNFPPLNSGTNNVPITVTIGNTTSQPKTTTVVLTPSTTGAPATIVVNNVPAGTVTVAPITGGF